MLKMRAPDGVTAFSHQGYPVEIGGDGAVHVDARHRLDLEAHGFTQWDQPTVEPGASLAAGVPAMPPDRAYLVKAFAERMATASDEEVETMLQGFDDQLRREREDAERLDPSAVTIADIDVMKRHELFAFLKKRSIPAVPPIDNDTLRAKARAAIAA